MRPENEREPAPALPGNRLSENCSAIPLNSSTGSQPRPRLQARKAAKREEFASGPAWRSAISSAAMLSRSEEYDLIRRYQAGDRQAGGRVIVAHLTLAGKIARERAGPVHNVDDLVQESIPAFYRALDEFDLSLGWRFSSYARHKVKGQISALVKKNADGLTELKGQKPRAVSLSTPRVWDDHEDGHYCDTLITPETISPDWDWTSMRPPDTPEQLFVAAEDEAIASRIVWRAHATLDRRSKRIIEARVLRDEPLTLTALAREFKITHQRVKQIEKAALRSLTAAVWAQAFIATPEAEWSTLFERPVRQRKSKDTGRRTPAQIAAEAFRNAKGRRRHYEFDAIDILAQEAGGETEGPVRYHRPLKPRAAWLMAQHGLEHLRKAGAPYRARVSHWKTPHANKCRSVPQPVERHLALVVVRPSAFRCEQIRRAA